MHIVLVHADGCCEASWGPMRIYPPCPWVPKYSSLGQQSPLLQWTQTAKPNMWQVLTQQTSCSFGLIHYLTTHLYRLTDINIVSRHRHDPTLTTEKLLKFFSYIPGLQANIADLQLISWAEQPQQDFLEHSFRLLLRWFTMRAFSPFSSVVPCCKTPALRGTCHATPANCLNVEHGILNKKSWVNRACKVKIKPSKNQITLFQKQ